MGQPPDALSPPSRDGAGEMCSVDPRTTEMRIEYQNPRALSWIVSDPTPRSPRIYSHSKSESILKVRVGRIDKPTTIARNPSQLSASIDSSGRSPLSIASCTTNQRNREERLRDAASGTTCCAHRYDLIACRPKVENRSHATPFLKEASISSAGAAVSTLRSVSSATVSAVS